ncbi:MAG: phosphoribosylglycinamide synthetase [Candidatus Tectimicrobiota bacterium]|nr:MAG: phosphoribosylglycinamide synthetase [Candidatus Tectomicrobia bacterium]
MPSRPRLLLLMTTRTYKSHDFLEAARRLGAEVVVGTEREQALAALTPGTTLALDFLQPQAATAAIVAFARQFPLTAVVGVDDDTVPLAAMAAAALGLPHNPAEAVLATRNKYQLRQRLAAAGLPTPHFACFPLTADPAAVAVQVPYPCVLKPLFLSASRGVMRADTPEQFVAAWQRLAALLRTPEVASRGGALAEQILVEAYLPGQEVALEGLLVRGNLQVLALFDKPDPLEGPFFEETLYVTPSRLPAATQEAIAACVAACTRALGLREGPVHAELRLNAQGPWPLELAARTIGGLCARTLRFGTGMSLEELVLRHALGLEVTSYAREGQAAGVMMLPIPQRGTLRAVHGQEAAKQVPGIEALHLTVPLGHEVVPLPEGDRYLGFLFARAATPAHVEAALREAYKRLTFVITPTDA